MSRGNPATRAKNGYVDSACAHVGVAFTIAKMPAPIASGNLSHASMTAVRSGKRLYLTGGREENKPIVRKAMELTPIQRTVLLRYKGFLDRPPTASRIFTLALPYLVLLIGLVIISAYSLPTTVTAFCGGMAFWAIGYQISFSRKVVRAIPTIVEFLDWTRVNRALDLTPDDELLTPTRR
jgi:hypothetical protein